MHEILTDDAHQPNTSVKVEVGENVTNVPTSLSGSLRVGRVSFLSFGSLGLICSTGTQGEVNGIRQLMSTVI